MVASYGDRICRVKDNVTSISYQSGQIDIRTNGTSATYCTEEKSKAKVVVPPIGILIESLGRYQGDPPPVVASAARSRKVTYRPIVDNSKLIAVRVFFGDDDQASTQSKPIYLVGAAATWIPPGVVISNDDWNKYKDSLDETIKAVNANPSSSENAAPGFAVAAFMGSKLARVCFPNGAIAPGSPCQ
jgi:hypothetical protein